MITKTFEQSYISDEAVRYKEILRKDELVKRVIEIKNRSEWASTELYPHPLKRIERAKKFSLLELLKSLLP